MDCEVILVDDDPKVLRAMYYTLKRSKVACNISNFSEPKKALKYVKKLQDKLQHNSTVIISDYLMPEMRGDDFLVETKKFTPGACRIMVTAYGSLLDWEALATKCGIMHFMAKPPSPDKFVDLVARALEYCSNRQAIHTNTVIFTRWDQFGNGNGASVGVEDLSKKTQTLIGELVRDTGGMMIPESKCSATVCLEGGDKKSESVRASLLMAKEMIAKINDFKAGPLRKFCVIVGAGDVTISRDAKSGNPSLAGSDLEELQSLMKVPCEKEKQVIANRMVYEVLKNSKEFRFTESVDLPGKAFFVEFV